MTAISETYIGSIASRIRDRVHESTPPNQSEDELYLLYAVLMLVKGEAVTREDVHNAWAAWKAPIDPDHESIRPFAELPLSVQAEDDPYVEAIRAEAQALRAHRESY